jgi:TatD DNase family protein
MRFVDSHVHLTSDTFENDRDDVIRRAVDAGARFLVNPGTDLEDSRRAVELADRYPEVYACVGFHPHDARKADEQALAAIEELSTHPRVVAIGEIGLDYHYDLSPRDTQREVFRAHLDIARRRDLPVVLHTRESLEDTVTLVEQALRAEPAWRSRLATPTSRFPAPKGVFHCFPGDLQAAWRIVHLGFYVSLPGIVTFKNAGNAAAVARGLSVEHMLLETDSPYMAPAPLRGSRNEPANLPIIAQRIAELQDLAVEDIVRTTNYSAHRLFGLGDAPSPVFTYPLRQSLYLNLTIRCDADCIFCDRKGEAVVKGHNLRITREPTAEEVIREIGDPTSYREIVFCGFGEPTVRLEVLKQIARWVKARGGTTRLNTDGHGNIINKRNIVPELVGLIDGVSISLNSTDPEEYGSLMRVDGKVMFAAMVEFARDAVRLLPRVVMTIVDMQSVDEDRARAFVENEIGAVFVKRPLF